MNDQQRMFESENSNYRFNYQLNHAAMQMALDWFEWCLDDKPAPTISARGIAASLREALAQPQGEWVDLTDYEIGVTFTGSPCLIPHQNQINGLRAVITKFKEKNTPPVVPQGEPVVGAYEVVNESGTEWELVYPAAIHKYKMIPEHRITQTFYTAPPVVAQGEPVAWVAEGKERVGFGREEIRKFVVFDQTLPVGTAFYTTPPSVEAAIEATKEKAAKLIEERAKQRHGYDKHEDAAAIRSMK